MPKTTQEIELLLSWHHNAETVAYRKQLSKDCEELLDALCSSAGGCAESELRFTLGRISGFRTVIKELSGVDLLKEINQERKQ